MAQLTRDLVNHVLDSTDETLDTMMDLKLYRCPSPNDLAMSDNQPLFITAIIGLVSKHDFLVRLVLTLPDGVAIRMTASFLGEPQGELNADVIDAMKEVVNIVAGAASAKMPEHLFSLTLPVVLIGQNTTCAGARSDMLSIPLFVPDCGRLRIGLSVNDS